MFGYDGKINFPSSHFIHNFEFFKLRVWWRGRPEIGRQLEARFVCTSYQQQKLQTDVLSNLGRFHARCSCSFLFAKVFQWSWLLRTPSLNVFKWYNATEITTATSIMNGNYHTLNALVQDEKMFSFVMLKSGGKLANKIYFLLSWIFMGWASRCSQWGF